jgi:hypothetical protein
MIKKGLLAGMLFVSQAVFAALPPLAQGNREIRAILQSQDTYTLLGGSERIEQIIRTENGYLLITAHKELLVEIQYIPTDQIGPAVFELVFHQPVDSE